MISGSCRAFCLNNPRNPNSIGYGFAKISGDALQNNLMNYAAKTCNTRQLQSRTTWAAATILFAGWLSITHCAATEENLLKNPGFEEMAPGTVTPPSWTTTTDSVGTARLTDNGAHGGGKAIAIPAHTSVEQKVGSLSAGAYLARCWVKSESEQSVTFLVEDTDQPWAAYTCSEIKVPRRDWVQIESFCALDRNGSLTLRLGGMSKEFNLYHGTSQEMGSAIVADDFELIRYEPKLAALLAVWDANKELGPMPAWSAKEHWSPVESAAHKFTGTPVIQGRHLAGAVRKSDGALIVYAVQASGLKQRCTVTPSPVISDSRFAMVQDDGRTGIRVSSATGDRFYTAWFSATGLLRVEASHVAEFQVRDCRLRYGLLPSFAGTDICYAPAKMSRGQAFDIPSTQWFVGLVDGNDSMLVAAWEADSQPVSLGLSGEGQNRLIDSLSIGTQNNGFSLSFVEHASIWRQESLKEDWLGEYQPIGWRRPFPARWMGSFFVSTGGRPSFRDPGLNYSFPVAYAKTRMWGVWFEDWNHYPFFFDGTNTIFHFEKTFIPQGEALIYFLEPAAADLFSPSQILAEALGPEKAASIFDFDANRIRKLKYSTPDQFLFDRPVCATTTRLSKIKQEEKATLGVDLATHLYEFIQGIRGRVDQYEAFFAQMKIYLANNKQAHPEANEYVAELEGMVAEAQRQSEEIYATPLSSVQKKTEAMKALLREGKGDGFNCGNLDVRGPAGSQDDLCRRYNRFVIKLAQTAALQCGDSAQKAIMAKYILDQSRAVLRQPTRWEPRRTLYFFEP